MSDPALPAILYVVHRFPYPPDKGDRIRAFHLLRFLARRTRVFLACLADEPVPDESLRELSQYCARIAVVPLGKRSRWVRALAAAASGRTISEGAFRSPRLQKVLREQNQRDGQHAQQEREKQLRGSLATDVPVTGGTDRSHRRRGQRVRASYTMFLGRQGPASVIHPGAIHHLWSRSSSDVGKHGVPLRKKRTRKNSQRGGDGREAPARHE